MDRATYEQLKLLPDKLFDRLPEEEQDEFYEMAEAEYAERQQEEFSKAFDAVMAISKPYGLTPEQEEEIVSLCKTKPHLKTFMIDLCMWYRITERQNCYARQNSQGNMDSN